MASPRQRPEAARRPGRRLVSSGGPWEELAGYSRAVVVGDSCWVSGTTDAGPDGRSLHPGDMAGQARAVLRIIELALRKGGFSLSDVVRTRMFVTDMARASQAVAVHGEVFGHIRPAATLVEVARLIDDSLLIEIEAEARRA
ncbi:MAG TPA: RidA family protein [Candidatus Limnocylindrales bacterium]|nr:RidA family protein [Candidatus Limnocylindrales bacterium]